MASPGGLARIFSDLIPSEKVLVAFTSAAMPWLTRVGILTSEAEAENEKERQALFRRKKEKEEEEKRAEKEDGDPVDPPPEQEEPVQEEMNPLSPEAMRAFNAYWQTLLGKDMNYLNISAPFSLFSIEGVGKIGRYQNELISTLEEKGAAKAWEYVESKLGEYENHSSEVVALRAAILGLPEMHRASMVNYAAANTPHPGAAPDTRLA